MNLFVKGFLLRVTYNINLWILIFFLLVNSEIKSVDAWQWNWCDPHFQNMQINNWIQSYCVLKKRARGGEEEETEEKERKRGGAGRNGGVDKEEKGEEKEEEEKRRKKKRGEEEEEKGTERGGRPWELLPRDTEAKASRWLEEPYDSAQSKILIWLANVQGEIY